MSASEKLRVEADGKITLPVPLRDRYGLTQDTPLRVIETRGGILLIPLTGEPMSEGLAFEIEQWQSLNAEALEVFPYEDDAA